MKSIEERAREYASKQGDIALSTLYNAVLAIINNAYIAGAVEQKIIDEEVRLKKCDTMTKAEYDRETAFVDWFFENNSGVITHSDAIEWSRKQTIDEAYKWVDKCLHFFVMKNHINYTALEQEFRKTMEE